MPPNLLLSEITFSVSAKTGIFLQKSNIRVREIIFFILNPFGR
jgi:hypothetical protein